VYGGGEAAARRGFGGCAQSADLVPAPRRPQTLVLATNRNDILPQFFATGCYKRQADVHQTLSPAMDIQVSSNFERYLYHLASGDTAKVAAWMRDFKDRGEFHVSAEQLGAARATFRAVSITDEAVRLARRWISL